MSKGYKRERSAIWQCRYKIDEQWLRETTKERDLAKSKKKAHEIRMKAEIRKSENLPVVKGYGGKLNIRPPYQREFVYKDKQRDAVINTLTRDFPLNVMYSG